MTGLLALGLMRRALAAGVIVSAICSALSPFVVLRRMSFVGHEAKIHATDDLMRAERLAEIANRHDCVAHAALLSPVMTGFSEPWRSC